MHLPPNKVPHYWRDWDQLRDQSEFAVARVRGADFTPESWVPCKAHGPIIYWYFCISKLNKNDTLIWKNPISVKFAVSIQRARLWCQTFILASKPGEPHTAWPRPDSVSLLFLRAWLIPIASPAGNDRGAQQSFCSKEGGLYSSFISCLKCKQFY